MRNTGAIPAPSGRWQYESAGNRDLYWSGKKTVYQKCFSMYCRLRDVRTLHGISWKRPGTCLCRLYQWKAKLFRGIPGISIKETWRNKRVKWRDKRKGKKIKPESGDELYMTHEEFEQAAQYWNRKEQTAMPKEALQQAHFNLQWWIRWLRRSQAATVQRKAVFRWMEPKPAQDTRR